MGMSSREALGLGCMLNGRGIMELVVASIAYQKGFIGCGRSTPACSSPHRQRSLCTCARGGPERVCRVLYAGGAGRGADP